MNQNIQEYFVALKEQCDSVFTPLSGDFDRLGSVHDLATRLYEISELIADNDESRIVGILPSQLESSALNLCFGLYRQAFSSLRLFLELGLGAVHFSVNKLEHREWQVGAVQGDIKWSKLIDLDSGVLSSRFAEGYFSELKPNLKRANSSASTVYRELSQFVHGNHDTWEKTGLKIIRNTSLEKEYFQHFNTVKEILIIAIACRYMKGFQSERIDSSQLESLFEEILHLDCVRTELGRP